jgi:hypothetical protein
MGEIDPAKLVIAALAMKSTALLERLGFLTDLARRRLPEELRLKVKDAIPKSRRSIFGRRERKRWLHDGCGGKPASAALDQDHDSRASPSEKPFVPNVHPNLSSSPWSVVLPSLGFLRPYGRLARALPC